jgi:hypothetical protein
MPVPQRVNLLVGWISSNYCGVGRRARTIFKNRQDACSTKKSKFSYGILREKKQAPVLFQRTFAMRQGIHSLSDFSKREKVIEIVPTRG